MANHQKNPLLQVETTCGTLLCELQIIWDEIGESDTDRDKMLLELEQECLEVYRRKVDQANKNRAQLRQTIADFEAELAAICSAMGERPVHIRQVDKSSGSLKEEFQKILPQLEEMQKRKLDRRNQFVEVLEDIEKISNEIFGSADHLQVDETDLSLSKLEELHIQLQALENEKNNRLKQIHELLDTLNSLCLVLGMDFKHTINEVHPTYGDPEGSRSISSDTIQHFATAISKLREIKIQRMQKLQDLATTMLELWHLMDTPLEEQQMFQNVTCNIAASEHEITEPNTLSLDIIKYVEAEVSRLEELKSSKMKELVLKKRSELEEICRKTHLIPEADNAIEYAIEAIESGNVDPAIILEQIELQIANVKEEAFSRKDILDKVEKWLAACEEECWLEEYNRDDNRYSAGKGAHLTLKRAEKARSLVNKLPGMVEALTSKTIAWEYERGIEFLYDGIRLLSMLEEYTVLRQEKEEEKRRQRDQKKLKVQLIAEQEALYGSKPSPSKAQNVKKAPRFSTGGANNRSLSVGGTMLRTPKADSKATPFSTISASRRGSEVASLPVQNHSFGAANTRDPDSAMIRKPFSPISSTVSSKANMLEEVATRQADSKKTLSFTTPLKTTLKAMPTTPSTVSIPMQTAISPACQPVYGAYPVDELPEEIEYSFEERRAGFVVPRAHIKSLIQVQHS
ncbi:hypothetical protein K2173_026685 [Erythroxylum novogranatense]|uniref:65-kDa microtubule-associated protein 3-like n=1 Tax=Erythroxylum novogranatense TaxID=1862640 RepID=A0AAV8TX93_9ROSI|nr:hypothetical protein K2173_026685 [Erythroxylum novogranatense]